MDKTTEKQNNRIVELGKQVWALLTDEERENYYMVGTLTFVEDIVALLNIPDFDWDSVETLDTVHDKIFE